MDGRSGTGNAFWAPDFRDLIEQKGRTVAKISDQPLQRSEDHSFRHAPRGGNLLSPDARTCWVDLVDYLVDLYSRCGPDFSRPAFPCPQVHQWPYRLHHLPRALNRTTHLQVPGLPFGNCVAHQGAKRLARFLQPQGGIERGMRCLPLRAQRRRLRADKMGP